MTAEGTVGAPTCSYLTITFDKLQMCAMVFQVQGKTYEYVQLVQDGDGITFVGRLFCQFNVSANRVCLRVL
jgi:hypothetical protein